MRLLPWKIASLIATITGLPLALALPAQAGVNRWTPFGPGVDRVTEVVSAPAGGASFLFAIADPDGEASTVNTSLFASRDGGATWTASLAWPADGNAPERVAVSDADPDDVVAGGRNGDVSVSRDGGDTWTLVRTGSGPPDTSLSLAWLGGSLYRGGATGLLASSDAGLTWETSFAEPVFSVAGPAAAPGTIYLGTRTGVWKSTDGGDTWNPSLRKDGRFERLAVALTSPGTVYAASRTELWATQDGGGTWTLRSKLKAGAAGLTVDAGSPNRVYASLVQGLSVSQDGGRTWRTTAKLNGNGMTASPGRSGTVYAGTQRSGLAVSRDSGATWKTSKPRGLGLAQTLFVEGDPANPAIFYMSRFSSLEAPLALRSADGGRTWTPFEDRTAREQTELREVSFDPDHPNVVYAARGGVFRVENGGRRWVPLGFGTAAVRDSISDVAAVDGALLASGAGLFRSTDGGQRWKVVLPGTTQTGALRLPGSFVVDPFDRRTVYVPVGESRPAGPLRYFRSRDAGATWSPLPVLDRGVLAASSSTPGLLYGGKEPNIVVRSRDRGTTWETIGPIPAGFLSTLAVHPDLPQVLLAGSFAQGLFLSRDAGRTWEPFNDGLVNPGGDILGRLNADPGTPGRFFLTLYDGGAFEITVD